MVEARGFGEVDRGPDDNVQCIPWLRHRAFHHAHQALQFHWKPVLRPVTQFPSPSSKMAAGQRYCWSADAGKILAGSLAHRVHDFQAHRKVMLALSVQRKSMLSLTEDPSPRSLGTVPTSSVRVTSSTKPRTPRTNCHLS